MSDLPDANPFFIVGSGRSGTTLLRSILAAHSRLAVTPETHFVKRALRDGAAVAGEPRDFEAFWRDLIDWQRFRDLGVAPQAVLDRLNGRRGFADILAAMLAAYGAANGKPRVGEKTPSHYRHIPLLLRWFPQARVIAIHRDPRAVVASHLKAPWVVDRLRPGTARAPLLPRARLFHVADRALLWMQAYDRFLPAVSVDRRVTMVAYEDLIARPEPTARRLCAFLGEAFEPGMLAERQGRVGQAAASGALPPAWSAWRGRHEDRAAGPISATGHDRWRAELAPTEIGMIEAVCGPRMERLGYAPEGPRSGALASLARALQVAGETEGRIWDAIDRTTTRGRRRAGP